MKNENQDTAKAGVDYQIDNLDRQILTCLMADATRPYTDIAQELIVSHGTVHVRMKKMKEMGIVTGSHLAVDTWKLGFDITAFVGVHLEKGSHYHNIVAQMREIPHIVELYATTGSYCMLLKIVCRDSRHLLYVLRERIQAIDGVGRTETFILMEETIQRPVPLE